MRRFAPLIMVLLALAPAAAQDEDSSPIEYDAKGSLRVRGFYLDDGLTGRDHATESYLDLRLRLAGSATLYSEVTGHLAVEVGDIRFGDEGAGGAKTAGGLGSDGVVFENKNLYLEWHPARYSFKFRGGLYGRESDPYGLVLSDDVAGLHGEAELLGLNTTIYADAIMAVENSRNDLDGDGEFDNDYNDRTVFLGGVRTTALEGVTLELFAITDLDNSLRSPNAVDVQVTTYWVGLSGRGGLGPLELEGVAIGAYGRRDVAGGGAGDVRVKGLALEGRVSLELPFVTVSGQVAWASGRDPKRDSVDEAFPVIAPFYGVSEIIYQGFGGFNVTGSKLSGTAYAMLKLRSTPVDDLTVELVTLWAWYTSDRDVSGNTRRFNSDARDIGFEADLNVSYEVVNGFKVFARGGVLFTGRGYEVEQDARRRGYLGQVIVGAQISY